MPLTLPKIEDSPLRSTLPDGGSPATDSAYLTWRDDFLSRHAERLVARFWHSCDFDDLMPAWRFDDVLCERLGIVSPMFGGGLLYNHKIRHLGLALSTRPALVIRHASAILGGER